MIHTVNNILKPVIAKIKRETEATGKPETSTLLDLAERLVACAWTLQTYNPFYTLEERDEAKQILKKYGLEKLGNCSPRYRERVLNQIDAAKKLVLKENRERVLKQIDSEKKKLEAKNVVCV